MTRPSSRSRGYLTACAAFVTLGLTLATAADARQRLASTPYGQTRQAVDAIAELVAELDENIGTRVLEGEEGPAIDCLRRHATTATTLRDLAKAERSRLVEALADGNQAGVVKAHRSVMVWHVKAKVAAEAAGECAVEGKAKKRKKRK